MSMALPVTFKAMGETVFENLALHALSVKRLQYWMVGIGVITLLSNTLSVLATMTKIHKFRIFVSVLLLVTICVPMGLLVWGQLESEARKSYFLETWNDMDLETKYLIQRYYSCCGFESPTEWSSSVFPVNESCYAINSSQIYWPNGCYERVTSFSLPAPSVTDSAGDVVTVGDPTYNAFAMSFVISMCTLTLVQIMITVSFMVALVRSRPNIEVQPFSPTNQTIINPYADENDELANKNLNSVSKQVDEKSQQNGVTNGDAHTAHIDVESSDIKKKKPWYKAVPDRMSSAYCNAFYWLGVRVGSHPKMTILFSLLLTGAFTLGMLQRYESPGGGRGFLSSENQLVKQYGVYIQTFPVTGRDQFLLVEDESDVLSSENYMTTLNLDASVKALRSNTGKTFSDICMPVVDDCIQRSVFEFWSFNHSVLTQVSNSALLEEINKTPLISPVFNDNIEIEHILGGIARSSAGNITAARAHLMRYVTTSRGGDWEELFIALGRKSYDGLNVYVNARSSRFLETNGEYQKELPLLFAGFGLIFIYIILMTGKFSFLEHRTYIALMGVATAGLSMASGIGFAACFGLEWSVLHLIVPFLVIGIGVDDMFVILQAWNFVQNNPNLEKLSIPEKTGHTLKTAGVSITVTSVTDLVAFAVGASSELAAFASFSVYVAICVILLFFLECTFFTACIVLDERRKEKRYDACLACCYQHEPSYKPGKCSRRELSNTFFEDGLGRIVTKLPFAIIAILITLGVTSLMAWGFYKLKVQYNADWYLPSDSYIIDFNEKYDDYFNGGEEAAVYVIGADFYAEREKLHELFVKLNASSDVNSGYLVSWFENFVSWAGNTKGISNVYATNAFENSTAFYAAVQEFLFSTGRKYVTDVVFNSGVMVGSRFPFRHKVVPEDVDNVIIMENIQAEVDEVGFSNYSFPYGRFYFNFEITRIIRNEVYRNLGITLLCVFVMVVPMVASLQMSFWVITCVIFTMVDVAGSMYFAGLSIEASTIITLLLSVGLAVDYAAHIGHKFLILSGTRKIRARVTLSEMGPAVFNGGFSTFLALVLLGFSDTYSYKVFFTVFACVVGYGLWNGLVFLPCILAFVGPPSNITATEAMLTRRHYRKKHKTSKKPKNPIEIEEIQ